MDIVKQHFNLHPEEQLSDIVKLLFQRSFGAEHMINNPDASLERLINELDGIDYNEETPLYEDIGGDFARINLAAVKGKLKPETVNRIFVLSANGERNAKEALIKDLEALVEADFLPFSEEEKRNFVDEYVALGCPALSHSEAYRKKYAPGYRIARKKYAVLLPLFIEIEENLEKNGRVAVGIDGMAASGKTTMAKTVAEIYFCNVFHTDDYFLPPEMKTPARLAEIGGNIDYERMKSEIINNLFEEKDFEVRKYDCFSQTLGEKTVVKRTPVTVVEGVYSMHPYFGDVYSVKRVLKICREEQLKRLEKRNPSLLPRFIREWLPMEDRYFNALSE